jgi:hypothetical protein
MASSYKSEGNGLPIGVDEVVCCCCKNAVGVVTFSGKQMSVRAGIMKACIVLSCFRDQRWKERTLACASRLIQAHVACQNPPRQLLCA